MRFVMRMSAVLGLAVLLGVAACSSGGDDGGNPVGTWTFVYDWDCDGSTNSTVFHIYDNGKFKTRDGAAGVWSFSDDVLTLTFSAGTRFEGAFLDDDTLRGTMASLDGKKTGCWSGTRTDVNP